MKVRFLADENVDQAIVKGITRRQPAIDFITATEANILGLPDPDVLAKAASERRILVTHDIRTMPLHFSDFVRESDSPGVIIVAQRAGIGWIVDELIHVWRASDSTDWVNQISPLPYKPPATLAG